MGAPGTFTPLEASLLALRDAGRAARSGAPVVIATWGRPDHCEAAAYLRAVAALVPGPPDPFALSAPGALEDVATRAGLAPGARCEVPCVMAFPDDAALVRAFSSTDFAVRAIDAAGEARVAEEILVAAAPYRTSDGAYRIENVFTYLAATA